MTRTTRRSTAPDRLVAQVEDDPAGSAAYWFRKRLDTEPGAKLTRITAATVWVGIVVLLVAEAADAVRTLRRRTAHLLAEWWAAVERRERREARRADVVEIAAVAARITRQADSTRLGAWGASGGSR